jgi:hypothetical protein
MVNYKKKKKKFHDILVGFAELGVSVNLGRLRGGGGRVNIGVQTLLVSNLKK